MSNASLILDSTTLAKLEESLTIQELLESMPKYHENSNL